MHLLMLSREQHVCVHAEGLALSVDTDGWCRTSFRLSGCCYIPRTKNLCAARGPACCRRAALDSTGSTLALHLPPFLTLKGKITKNGCTYEEYNDPKAALADWLCRP